MSSITVTSRAHRALRELSAYKRTTVANDPPGSPSRNNVIGVYVGGNVPEGEGIIVAELGLYVNRELEWEFIPFSLMEKAEAPPTKRGVKGFNIKLIDGRIVWLPLSTNKDNRLYDAYEFLRFLDRVIADRKSREAEVAEKQ